MSSPKNKNPNSKMEPIKEEDIYNIKIFRRTLENNTHEVIEDTKIKKITSWRKSKKKFFQSLILNILSLGTIHIISLFYPNLYIKLYCNRRKPKECDFFLVEDIYGKLTLCKKIFKKDKSQKNTILSSDNSKEPSISSSLSDYNSKIKKYITKNLTYSFKYREITYEYNEKSNEIIPVYMNLSNLTCKDIFNYFSEGLSSEKSVKIFLDRYGKNEYILNFKMVYLYFLNIELPNIILVVIISCIELSLDDYVSFIAKMIIVIILLSAEFLNLKLTIYDLYKKEFTLDGEKKKIRVKRNHKLNEKSDLFINIDNCELLPGDIIFLKSNDIVPCDCLILEGECMANSNNLIGNLNIFRKISLENKNILFTYQLNTDNILYHGMKIVKSYSNLKSEYISALCINTGPNTYKANQYSNALYFLERNNKYKDDYRFFNSDRKSFICIKIAIFITSVIFGIFYAFTLLDDPKQVFNFDDKGKVKLFVSIIIRVCCKTIMPMFYLLKSFIILLATAKLKKENVHTFDKSKLLRSSTIDTLFINKTGTLCDDKYEINGYHPIYVNHHNINNLLIKNYNMNQTKEINLQLMKYYKQFLKQMEDNFCVKRKDIKEKANLKCNEYSTLFLECLLSCNNLEKYGMEIFGNSIDLEIFKAMKWDIKSDINFNSNNLDSDMDYQYNKLDINFQSIEYNLFEKSRNDIFPSNYYKITESVKNENLNNRKDSNNSLNYTNFSNKFKKEEEKTQKRFSIITNQLIENDIFESNINSYKLRIYKRFMKNVALSSSSITFNFLTKELRFNTKGIPEDILDKCNPSTIPDNLNKIISYYRRRGFIIIICASKIINMEQYSFFDSEDKYMNNLNFYGFITLKNKLKDEIIYALNELRLFKCNFVISTGDDIYNTLSVGFESTILENKNIYSFDKDEIKNRIVIKKIYNAINAYAGKEEDEDLDIINDKSSKRPTSRLKQSKLYDYSDLNLNNMLKSDKRLNQLFKERNNSLNTKTNISEASTPKNRNYKKSNISNSSNLSNIYLTNNENPKNSINTTSKNLLKKLHLSKKNLASFDFNRKNTAQYSQDNANGFNEKNMTLYYYPEIFEDHQELNEDCIYCISGNVFDFLYKNKNKRHAKILLDKIHEKCRIFFNMASLTKSKVIDYYREYPDNCIWTIGECQSDIDSIITSNIGINLQAPKNYNTILSHFYSPEENLLSINKIIKAGRSLKENILLMKISCCIYTLMLNSYILSCVMKDIDIVQGQLNFLEIAFLLLAITAFTSKVDKKECTNNLINKSKLFNCYYILQIAGLLVIKAFSIYFHAYLYYGNDFIDLKRRNYIYTTFYFLFCIEQLFSTIMVLNFNSFYRTSWFFNTPFIILSLITFFYFVIIVTLTNSNFNIDTFNYLYFEYLENLVDAYDEENKIKIFIDCLLDFIISILYSRVIYYIFYRLSNNN